MKLFSVLLLASALYAPMAFAHEGADCHCGPKKCDMACKDHKGKTCECKEGCKHKNCHYHKADQT